MTRYIFVTGGVVSSLGKGIAAATIGNLLQARGYSVRIKKLDPYLNVDPGTMNPTQHGEVFVTDDGAETDLDLGHYERFTGRDATANDNITTGRIYRNLIEKERRGDFLGATVQVIPHVTNEIKAFILSGDGEHDFIICEIGGTVGDIEAMPFLESVRQLRNEMPRGATAFVHLTLMPWIAAAGELKTKPTQHSVRDLQSLGIHPDVLLVRSDREIPETERRKLAQFCNVRPEAVIQGLDVEDIHDIPLAYHREGLDEQVLAAFGIDFAPRPNLTEWQDFVTRLKHQDRKISISIVGKYTSSKDAYKSIVEALRHAGAASSTSIAIRWIDAEDLERQFGEAALNGTDAILVPGGFGERGAEGKIAAIRHAREKGIPFLGICFGMQMAVIEAARNLLGMAGASSSEFGVCREPIVGLITEWEKSGRAERRDSRDDLGGTMRLGAYRALLAEGSVAEAEYGQTEITERHRHRYEVSLKHRDRFAAAGVIFSGISPDGKLPEIVEIPAHPWFVAVQFHPELKSRPLRPHPLFLGFVKAAIKQSAA